MSKDVHQNVTERKTKAFIGQLGIMPGLKYGPFTIEFRLGIGGRIARIESPQKINTITDGETKKLYVVYPADLVKSIVIHFGIF